MSARGGILDERTIDELNAEVIRSRADFLLPPTRIKRAAAISFELFKVLQEITRGLCAVGTSDEPGAVDLRKPTIRLAAIVARIAEEGPLLVGGAS